MISNWKYPGPDEVQAFWVKNFTSLHKNLVWHLNACLEGEIPRWMTKLRTILLQKDKPKGNEASNYGPVTCLPLTRKLLTGIISDKIYGFLENGNSKKIGEFCGKNNEVLDGGADLWY